jgi:hypothetical protein
MEVYGSRSNKGLFVMQIESMSTFEIRGALEI